MIPSEGGIQFLKAMKAWIQATSGGAQLGFYKENITLSRSNTYSGQASKECSFTGYQRISLPNNEWGTPTVKDDLVVLRGPVVDQSFTGITEASQIFGWFLALNVGGATVLLGEFKYTTPIEVTPPSLELSFYPQLVLGDCCASDDGTHQLMQASNPMFSIPDVPPSMG